MTEQLHPMVPPNILLNNWGSDWFNERENFDVLLTQAYQAGADAELEACCELLDNLGGDGGMIRRYRRPKPPSDKEQALEALSEMEDECLMVTQAATIRRALEALPDD